MNKEIKNKVISYLKKNFPNRKLLQDSRMVSEVNYEVYGFGGLQILVHEEENHVRYYPLIASRI